MWRENCRVCLKRHPKMKSLLGRTKDIENLLMIFTTFTNSELELDEDTPSSLCLECEQQLISSYNFHQRIKIAADFIKEYKIQLINSKIRTANSETDDNTVLNNNSSEFPQLEHDWVENDDVENERTINKRHVLELFPVKTVEEAIKEFQSMNSVRVSCILCQFESTGSKNLSIHMAHVHKNFKGEWCSKCNKLVHKLEEHRKSHQNDVDACCTLCNKLVRKMYMLEHLNRHKDYPSKNKIFTNGGLIDQKDKNNCPDLAAERSCKMKNFCKECNKIVGDRNKHLSKFHNGVAAELPSNNKNIKDNLSCKLCSKQFRSINKLKLHITLHTGDGRYRCSHCGKTKTTRRLFLEHLRTHTGEKPYGCTVCKKKFNQSAAFRTHMRQHTGKPEKCKLCNKTFCRFSELKLHLQKHAGVKPFLCTDCGKKFSQKSHLTEHTKIHSTERPYKCTYCKGAFKQKSALKCHINIHTGYKPLKCEQCSYACGKPYRLKQHILRQHSTELTEKSYVCRVCEEGFASTSRLNVRMSSAHDAVL